MSYGFERRTLINGDTFICLADDRPDWLHDAVMAAHDDEMPNDWRYDKCEDIVLAIIDDGLDEDDLSELADRLTDVYNSDLVRWLGDNLGRLSLVDEAVDELSYEKTNGIIGMISVGQFWVIEHMARILYEAIHEAYDEYETNVEEPVDRRSWAEAGYPTGEEN